MNQPWAMRRMKLHTSGVKLDKVGSLKDRVIQNYLIREAELEASKQQFLMLLTMVAPSIAENKRREWGDNVSKAWKTYLSNLFHIDIPDETPEEQALKKYYEEHVSKLRPSIKKDRKTKKLIVTGLEGFR